jgi:type I restriction enzyme S subunit
LKWRSNMKLMLEKIDLNNLDKSNWESFRFEDITNRVTEGVDPNITNLEKYVGLEHIDSEDIHIRRFGTPSDVGGGKLKCYPGDVIFGKRRAYLRKAATVDFEGICSAHAFVFRANSKVIDPNLFPFFLHSNQFMHRAVDISVGGLSPTINWGDLKGQEFLIPPKAEQARLAELLMAMDEMIEKEKSMVEKVVLHRSAVVENLINSNDFKIVKLKELLSRPKLEKAKDINREKILSVRLHLKGVCKNTSVDGLKLGATQYFVRKAGQFIYGKQNLFNGAIGIVPIELNNFLSSSDIPALDIETNKILPQYLMIYFGREKYYKNLEKHSSGSGSKRISENLLFEIEIKLPNIERQSEIVLKVSEIEKMIEKTSLALSSSIDLQKSIINQIF